MNSVDVNDSYLINGLTEDEVRQRVEAGDINHDTGPESRSYAQIIKANTLTFFNFFNAILASAVVIFAIRNPSLWANLAFMGVVFWNSALGIVQEIRAKRVVDKLNILTQKEVTVLRNGEKKNIPVDQIVKDDIFFLKRGDQLSVDAQVLDTTGLEVDESLLTGESRAINKEPGDTLLAGSVVLAGYCRAGAVEIGQHTYAKGIFDEAKKEKKAESMLVAEMERLVRGVAKIILPLGLLLILNGILFDAGMDSETLVVTTVSNLVSMIPEGLVLLTTMALAVSVVVLARHHTMAQTLSGIESLARIDVLCLDKTGTITTGEIEVEDIILLDESKLVEDAEIALLNLCRVFGQEGISSTQDALNRFASAKLENSYKDQTPWSMKATIPFSSERKYSAVCFDNRGSYVIGAVEFVFQNEALADAVRERHDLIAADGKRVLVLAHSTQDFPGVKPASVDQAPALPAGLTPLALLVLVDQIRPDVVETLDYFHSQNVALKIISGDNPLTTASVARRVGIRNAEKAVDMSLLDDQTDLSSLVEENNVFARVSPYQKHQLLMALQKTGHQVGMTGDGVNDVLALKGANCSVAMAAGSDAARAVADIILLNNNLSSMVKAVYEGRRVINNIQRVAILFLVKTFYATAMAILMVVFPLIYPLYPVQGTLINTLMVGIPSFFLALKPNRARVSGKFLANVLPQVTIPALTIIVSWITVQIAAALRGWTYDDISTVSLLIVGAIALITLFRVSVPFDLGRIAMILLSLAAFIAALIIFPWILRTLPMNRRLFKLAVAFIPATILLYMFFDFMVQDWIKKGYWARLMSGIKRILRRS